MSDPSTANKYKKSINNLDFIYDLENFNPNIAIKSILSQANNFYMKETKNLQKNCQLGNAYCIYTSQNFDQMAKCTFPYDTASDKYYDSLYDNFDMGSTEKLISCRKNCMQKLPAQGEGRQILCQSECLEDFILTTKTNLEKSLMSLEIPTIPKIIGKEDLKDLLNSNMKNNMNDNTKLDSIKNLPPKEDSFSSIESKAEFTNIFTNILSTYESKFFALCKCRMLQIELQFIDCFKRETNEEFEECRTKTRFEKERLEKTVTGLFRKSLMKMQNCAEMCERIMDGEENIRCLGTCGQIFNTHMENYFNQFKDDPIRNTII